jgi:glycogen operon protein
METWPGSAYPLGATFDGTGTNFALFSEAAERVELCLLDEDGGETRVEVVEADANVWHCYLPQVQPVHRYGYRVTGAYDPAAGDRCDPNHSVAASLRALAESQIPGLPASRPRVD